MHSPQLIYIMDPMCSWCWGFNPVLQALQAGYDNDAFCLAFDAADTQAQTQADFAWVSQLAVRGFPTLLAEHQQQYALITNGYQPYAALEPLLSRWISINAST